MTELSIVEIGGGQGANWLRRAIRLLNGVDVFSRWTDVVGVTFLCLVAH